MAAKAEKLPRGSRTCVSPGHRRAVKRDTSRLNRRLGRQLLDEAPRKVFTRGYAD